MRLEHCFGVRLLAVLQKRNFEYQVSVSEEYKLFTKKMEQNGEEYVSDLKLQNTRDKKYSKFGTRAPLKTNYFIVGALV